MNFSPRLSLSRRDFLRGVSGTALALGAAHPLLTWAQGVPELSFPGKDAMLVRSARFLDLEMPMSALNSWITPASCFFVRNHMHMPATLDVSTWRLSVAGEVEKPLSLSIDDLHKMEVGTVVNTLECAGNGRSFHKPRVAGVQWGRGAVGTGRFSGPRLRDVLERAGVKPTGKHVSFHGLDEVPGTVPPFIRSIPIEKAMDADTLLATAMNGAPLTKYHGQPLRSIVPGWVGAASVKWLYEIRVLDKEFVGNFMKPGYRFPNALVAPGGTVNPDETHPLTGLNVKSVIAAPAEGETVRGHLVIHGAAWAGEADITKIEVSTDGGQTWKDATLGHDQARYAWRLWSYRWKPASSGDYMLMSRASDSRGRTQPLEAAWNPSGYLFNAVDRVNIHVA